MRYVVEVHQTADGVQGQVTRQGSSEPEPFTGWLELLWLLEPAGEKPGPGETPSPRRHDTGTAGGCR